MKKVKLRRRPGAAIESATDPSLEAGIHRTKLPPSDAALSMAPTYAELELLADGQASVLRRPRWAGKAQRTGRGVSCPDFVPKHWLIEEQLPKTRENWDGQLEWSWRFLAWYLQGAGSMDFWMF
jgi:hypothetical protein